MRRPLFTIPWIDVQVGLEDIFVVVVICLGYFWAQSKVAKISSQLSGIEGTVATVPATVVNHELQQSERDGEIKGQLEFLRRQNVQIIQEITRQIQQQQ